ncbi:sex comb on midleg-like protein 4 isoform X1 [Trichechus manatus latirostris]|uniref:Sex comb on midleg-like protein 4 isoform X1 n=2 Tax=Trichechus manatus latirostris TaxID=127582 RepID=A0A2Y9QIZ3_TRIMA|nr:sex comb on midleg-like protein 4 isoform X1 [Trichechus manatus latirostris]XP_023583390.1 sex comb on midleg-like protein 4 isoform X1 [Trichechus manatus latirostris]XP_023583391.1 sex comb on midleg-like protein 4 isoform X1 [Trichechus manatus latirostris]XP_023583392.1 sex comb on midleg-like protein 4 isoform X1 [Trichechus manatus latirostris]
MQSQRIPGRKRGRPPLHSTPLKMAVPNLYSSSPGCLPAVKTPKKRGRKPGYKLKSQVLMTPLALSPPRSTPEPDLSNIPQDAATVPSLAVPQALTVCLYINKQANAGPFLEQRKVQQLPEHFGPERPSAVLQQAVQACIDCAHQQKLVFSLVKQGYGGEMVSVSASFDGKQHVRSLPVVNSIGYVLRFLAKLCRSLLCDDLFSHQPFPRGSSAFEKAQEKEDGRTESAKTVTTEECLVNPVGMNRYGVDPSTSAFNHRGSLYPSSSPYRKRQNSGDSRLGGGPATTAGGVRTNLLSSGSPSASGLRPPASSPKRNGTSLEGNRCASSLSPDGQDARRPRNRNPSTWTVEDVVWFVKDADPQALGPHVELFRKHPEKRNEGAPQEKQMRNQNASGRNTELPLACLRRKPITRQKITKEQIIILKKAAVFCEGESVSYLLS